MSLSLREIKALGNDKYEVTLADPAGATEHVVCTIFQHKGVTGIKMEPDLVMSSQPPRINSREITQAVLDYHHKQQTPESGPKP